MHRWNTALYDSALYSLYTLDWMWPDRGLVADKIVRPTTMQVPCHCTTQVAVNYNQPCRSSLIQHSHSIPWHVLTKWSVSSRLISIVSRDSCSISFIRSKAGSVNRYWYRPSPKFRVHGKHIDDPLITCRIRWITLLDAVSVGKSYFNGSLLNWFTRLANTVPNAGNSILFYRVNIRTSRFIRHSTRTRL
jgi:hypothetical protein